MSTFQLIVLGIFGAFVLIGVGVFATMGGLGGDAGVGSVTVWGTIDEQTIQPLISDAKRSDEAFRDVTYVHKDSATYHAELLNAMASGKAPDLFLVDLGDLQGFSDKIIPIPYKVVSQSTFLSSFVDGAQQFLTPQGVLAMPFRVDPLVMYWNRDIFASAGVATPPVYWNDFLTLAPKITSLDARSQVAQSTVSLGEWRNIDHAKEILVTLFMQSGDQVIQRSANGTPTSVFNRNSQNSMSTESVLRFYTEFSNPSKTSYSWNRGLPRSNNMFASGDLGIYFGFISEAKSFSNRNPNLRYSIAPIPQIEGNQTRYTYGNMTGLAIPRSARNPQGAVVVAQKMTGKSFSTAFSLATALPSVRRDVVFDTSANATAGIAAQAALIARGFLDPNPRETDLIFQTMIESVISGAKTTNEAVRDGAAELTALLSQMF